MSAWSDGGMGRAPTSSVQLRVGQIGTAAEAALTRPIIVRCFDALTYRGNWVQLVKFCCVGLTGYAVNLAVYSPLVKLAGVHYLPAAICSFTAAVTNNYVWNRFWTFRNDRGHVYRQATRFLCVSFVGLAANLVVLRTLVVFADAVSAQAIAVIVITPLSFVANKLWSFRR